MTDLIIRKNVGAAEVLVPLLIVIGPIVVNAIHRSCSQKQ